MKNIKLNVITIYKSFLHRMHDDCKRLCDFCFPDNSTRRILLKNTIWVFKHFKTASLLLNRYNLQKALLCYKTGGLRELLSRVNGKFHSSSVASLHDLVIEYANLWLQDTKTIIPQDAVVDIIIPVYNAYEYTIKCIQSVLDNSDINYNLYIINDCSTDSRINDYLKSLSTLETNEHCKDIYILDNDVNLGFICSVNRGLKCSQNNIILLNTDTEVPENWISRLMYPIYLDDTVASVTPYSNSAEICSFPDFCQNNDLPTNMTVNEVDSYFKRYGSQDFIEIPTGVGFCMAMNRHAIEQIGIFDEIYGKGYAEENDWCCRAAKYGYKNTHVRNLYVYHKHGVSFALHKDKSKQERIEENLQILFSRYPDYTSSVQKYIKEDPCRLHRLFISEIINSRSDCTKPGILFISHLLGGGTRVYQEQQILIQKSYKRVYSMSFLDDGKTLVLKKHDYKNSLICYLDASHMNKNDLKTILDAFNIQELYINHLLGYPYPDIFEWIDIADRKYTFFIHDFYSVCPRYNLLNNKLQYCGAETNSVKCSECCGKSKDDIAMWREYFYHFLSNASVVIAPSQNTSEIVKKYYPRLNILVKEHEVSLAIHKTYNPEFLQDAIKNIAVIGAIIPSKGVDIVYELADKIERSDLPVCLKVIGTTSRQNKFFRSKSGKFEITGEYRAENISSILSENRICLVVIPSIWPETFSYATAEAMESGYPVIVYNIGAPADRVKKYQEGWLVDEITSDALWEKIKNILFSIE